MINAEDHIALVYSVANRYKSVSFMEYEDIVSWGMVGLTKAISSFDETRGLKFSTYAVPKINYEILRAFRDDKGRFGNRDMRLNGEAQTALPFSSLTVINDDGKEVELDIATDEDFSIRTIKNIDMELALKKLSNEEVDIITKLYFEEKSQIEVGKEYGISQVQVSRKLKKAISKLREFMMESDFMVSNYNKINIREEVDKWLNENYENFAESKVLVKTIEEKFKITKNTACAYLSRWRGNRKLNSNKLKHIETPAARKEESNRDNNIKISELIASGSNGQYKVDVNGITLLDAESPLVRFKDINELNSWYEEFKEMFSLKDKLTA